MGGGSVEGVGSAWGEAVAAAGGMVSVWGLCCSVMGDVFWRHCWVLVMSREDDFLLSVPAGSSCAAGNGRVLPGHVQLLHCPQCYGKGICCALFLSFCARSLIRNKAWCHGRGLPR